MFFLIILPILASGFYYIKRNPRYKYKIHMYEGQHLYFISIFYGIIITMVSLMIISFIKYLIISNFNYDFIEGLKYLIISIGGVKNEDILIVIMLTLLSLLIVRVYCSLIYLWLSFRVEGIYDKVIRYLTQKLNNKSNINKKLNENKIHLLLLKDSIIDNPMLKLIYKSYTENDLLMLSMDDKKVYVGKVVNLSNPNEKNSFGEELVITPILSGYRNKDTLEVNFTTKYLEVDLNIELIIRMNNVTSITIYDEKIFNNFKEKQTS